MDHPIILRKIKDKKQNPVKNFAGFVFKSKENKNLYSFSMIYILYSFSNTLLATFPTVNPCTTIENRTTI